MGRLPVNEHNTQNTRCHNCRYWFERCCHALALLEGNNTAPSRCSHFVVESAAPRRMMEVTSW